MKVKKEHVIVVVAIVVPFGLVALGLWKAYELYKRKEENGPIEPK